MKLARKYVSILLLLILCVTSSFCAYAAPASASEWATPSEIIISDSLDAPELLAGIQLPTIANTVDYDDIYISLNYYNLTGQSVWKFYEIGSDGYFRLTVPDNYSQFRAVFFNLESGSLPPSGKYQFQAYVTPEAGGVFHWQDGYVQASNKTNNASTSFTSQIAMDTQQDNYGGIYASINLDTQNYSALQFILLQQSGETFTFPFSGYAKFAFARTGDATTGPDLSDINSSEDIQADINNSVGNISSGVSELSSQIAELIQTIINQLDALWNQFSGVFTSMFTAWQTHTDAIVTAIQNITTTASDGIQNIIDAGHNDADQIQENQDKNTEQITGGYDNSQITGDNEKLSDSMNQYDQAEDDLMDDVNGAINDVDFDIDLTSFSSIIKTVSNFLQDCYENSGNFKIVINLSLLVSLASCVIGLYRFKGGG